MDREYFECACHSPEHTLSFLFDDDDEFPAIYAYVFLGEKPWHKRIVDATRHVLGYKCKYGHFDEFVFDADDCDRMMTLLKKLKAKSKRRK